MKVTFIPQSPDGAYEDVYLEGEMIGCVRYYRLTARWVALTMNDVPIVNENGRGNAHFQTREEAAGRLANILTLRKMADN